MTSRGIRNNNPLNIRVGNNWQGEEQPNTDGAFEQFQSLEMGLRAGFVILSRYISRKWDTPRIIIEHWAPVSDGNHTTRYIEVVAQRSGIDPDAKLHIEYKNVMCRLVWAMCFVECGEDVSFGRIENAYKMAKSSFVRAARPIPGKRH